MSLQLPTTLSHTATQTYANCATKYFLSYVLGLQPKHKTPGLRRGSAFSDALEHDNIEAARDYYRKNYPGETYWVERETVAALYEGYRKRFPELGEREVRFDLPVGDTRFRNNGAIDEVLPCGEWLGENKLVSMWTQGSIDALRITPQATRYLDAWRKLGKPPVKGIKWRVTHWPGIRQRTKPRESAREYIARLREQINDSLDPSNEKIPGDKYYSEYHVYRTSAELDAFDADLAGYAAQIEHSFANNIWPKNTDHCGAFGKDGCAYLKACLGEAGWRSEYTTREERGVRIPQASGANDRTGVSGTGERVNVRDTFPGAFC